MCNLTLYTEAPMSDFSEARQQIRDAQALHRPVEEMVRGARVPYFRRGEMSIPAFKLPPGGDPETDGRAKSLRLMAKAATLPIDFFFYDLEDAAPDNPDFKPLARRFLIEAFQTLDLSGRVRAFRPNNIRTHYFEDDIVEVVGAIGHKLDAIVLPKTETAEEVVDVQRILRTMQRLAGRDNIIRLEVLIESPRAFVQAEQIASIDDVTALIFGAWDFARTIGGRVEPDSWLQDQGTARQLLPILAAAHGKEAVDAVTATLPIRPKDATDAAASAQYEAALVAARRDAEDARRIGYAAKWILHPDQIAPIHGAWTPSRQTALAALELTRRYTEAALAGSGAELHGNALADKAVVGTEWWQVRAGLSAGILDASDIQATGHTIETLERTVRTR
jgi:citrate lyase subunit beta/citryl-CoA lyase